MRWLLRLLFGSKRADPSMRLKFRQWCCANPRVTRCVMSPTAFHRIMDELHAAERFLCPSPRRGIFVYGVEIYPDSSLSVEFMAR